MDVKRLLKALSKEYPTIQSAVSQIVYLNGLLKLPKGTEYFFSDLHGEYEGFLRLLNSASGIVQDKINEVFQATLTEAEKNQLANLIYAPEQFLSLIHI